MKITPLTTTILCAGVALMVSLAACSSGATDSTPTPDASKAAALTGTITVYGAASLTATFTELAREFEAANPGVTVHTTFNGSSILVTQITGGAPADVFASADLANMAKLTTAKLIDATPVNFATNMLEIAVPPANPAHITSFADLAKPGVKAVVCAPAVPCGAATKAIEKATGVKLTPVSEETAVTGVLTKVATGEADAGLVYLTDVRGAKGTVIGIPFPESSTAVNTYPIAALSGSVNKLAAAAFVKFVTSAAGRTVLAAAGFGTP